MKRTPTLLPLLALLTLSLTSCSNGNNDDDTNFNAFIAGQITNNTNDTAEPVAINGAEFEFSEAENAFDTLFQ